MLSHIIEQFLGRYLGWEERTSNAIRARTAKKTNDRKTTGICSKFFVRPNVTLASARR
jgi:hypothetical protein